jgi:type IV secretion system protein VirD4
MNHTQPRPTEPGIDPALMALGGLIGGMIGVHWLGANLAAYVTHRRWPISLSDSVIALAALPRHVGEPRMAFPASIRADLTGPVTYWVSVVTVLVVVLVLAVAIGSNLAGSRTEAVNRRRRLGVPTQPTLATRKDLAPLLVRRPVPDRLVLLPYRRGWLATESPTARKPRGIQGAVALFGASQSGKTTALVSSITHWSGPAVVCSVKTDLMRLTIEAARSRGDVKVFDPLGISGLPTTRWSPLRAARTLEGASAAASLLMHSAGEGTGNDRFWRGQAEQLLTGMLWAAANLDGHTMANVVGWVLNLDIPDEAGRGTLAPLVRLLRDSADPRVAAEAAEIDGWLWGQWKTDGRTTSSVYATARDAVWPWANPRVRASAAGCDIDLDWLTNGSNTLYLCAPLGDHKNGVIFSAVLQDIIDQAFVRANLGRPLVPRLLLCVDETANTPLWKLPEWASTLTATGTQLVTVWQSKAQMDELFGHHADTLLTNHRTKLIFPSGLSDMTTANFISDLVGDEAVRSEIEDRRLLAPTGGRRSPDDRSPASSLPFLPPHVLRSANSGDALVIHGSLPPAWVHRRWAKSPPELVTL